MNAVEQKAALEKAGYTYRYSGYMHEWLSPNGKIVASDVKGTIARAIAYQHYLDNQKREILGDIVDMTESEIVAETQASETPAAPQVEAVALEDAIHAVENYPVDAIKLLFERIAKLEADLAIERSYGELARNHADKLTARINELEADNAALRNENARMLEDLATIAHKAKRIYNGDVDMESAKALALGIYTLSRQDITPTPPAQPAPEAPQSEANNAPLWQNAEGYFVTLEEYGYLLQSPIADPVSYHKTLEEAIKATPPAQEVPKRPVATRCRKDS